MRRTRLISALVLATAGCSVSDADLDALGSDDVTELPGGHGGELVDHRDPSRDGGGYGIILLDVTSSMNTVRPSTGNTRCYDAVVMARGIVSDFFDPNRVDGDGIAIWAFTNDPSVSDDVQPFTTGYYTDELSAIAALNNIPCSGSTPLADAMCKGLNGDGETFTIDPMLDRLYVLTDGLENNSNGLCSGPSGRTTTVGTWQYNVLAKMTSTGITVDTRYWIDPALLYAPQTIDSLAAVEDEDEPFDPMLEELKIVADIEELPLQKIDAFMGGADPAAKNADFELDKECDVTCQELELFKMLAEESGGSWGVVADDNPDYPLEETMDPVTGPVQPQPKAQQVFEEVF